MSSQSPLQPGSRHSHPTSRIRGTGILLEAGATKSTLVMVVQVDAVSVGRGVGVTSGGCLCC